MKKATIEGTEDAQDVLQALRDEVAALSPEMRQLMATHTQDPVLRHLLLGEAEVVLAEEIQSHEAVERRDGRVLHVRFKR
jgi:hypothetical protein